MPKKRFELEIYSSQDIQDIHPNLTNDAQNQPKVECQLSLMKCVTVPFNQVETCTVAFVIV